MKSSSGCTEVYLAAEAVPRDVVAHVSGPAAARVAAPRTVRVRAALGLARVALVAGQAGAGAVNLEQEEIVVKLQDIRPILLASPGYKVLRSRRSTAGHRRIPRCR